MINRLCDIVKKLEGNILVIDVDDKIIDAFNNNDKVNLFSITREKNTLGLNKFKRLFFNKKKNINIKKIKKSINKKSIDCAIIDIDNIFQYYKYLIRDTIYISNKNIYIYSSTNKYKDFLVERYNRYNVIIRTTDYKNGYIIEIINNDTKRNCLKNKYYMIKDTFYNIAETIGNFMAG